MRRNPLELKHVRFDAGCLRFCQPVLHPAADLNGPGLALVDLADVDFIGIDQKNKHHECGDPDPVRAERFDRSKHGEEAECESEDRTERREEEEGDVRTLGIENDSGFKDGDHQERKAERDCGGACCNAEPILHGEDGKADKNQDDTPAKFRLVSRVDGCGMIVSLDAPSADHHGEDANADGDDLNHGRQLQHQQNSDKQFGQNHDDFINVTVERFYHVGSLLTKGL